MSVKQSVPMFTRDEKRNIAIYIAGIMLYKFGLEAFNGSIVALAANRYDFDAAFTGTTPHTFERVGLLSGLNQAFQCVGSMLIHPLVTRFPKHLVLAAAVLFFGLLTAVLLIVDGSTGGTIRPSEWSKMHKSNDWSYYGDYSTNGIIPIFCLTGIAYGMIEVIRRVMPQDIVGHNVQKLKRMDAMVHIFYEVSGTAGAFCTGLALIPTLGNNMSFIITPICFALAAVVWIFLSSPNLTPQRPTVPRRQPTYTKAISSELVSFLKSMWIGAKIVLTSRKFCWLLPAYALGVYGHRFLENNIAPAIARRYLGNSAWSQIMVGGSNLGELLGALFVFFFTNLIHTPVPWLRLDSIMLLIVWYLTFWYPPSGQVGQAWMVAATFMPISFGWAAGDVSLMAYIQASLARLESDAEDESTSSAVLGFFNSSYIITYAILSPLLGRYMDGVFASTDGGEHGGTIRPAITNIAGIQFTAISVVIMAATFIPKGALSWNPKVLDGQDLDHNLGLDDGINLEEGIAKTESGSETGVPEMGPNSTNDQDAVQ